MNLLKKLATYIYTTCCLIKKVKNMNYVRCVNALFTLLPSSVGIVALHFVKSTSHIGRTNVNFTCSVMKLIFFILIFLSG